MKSEDLASLSGLTWFLHEAAPILLEHEADFGVSDLAVTAVDGGEAAGALPYWSCSRRWGFSGWF